MIVTVIIMVLGGLAVYGVRKYIHASKAAEPIHMIGGIKAAQESYKAETFSYKDISGAHKLTGFGTFYPTNSLPSQTKTQWGAGDDDVAKGWRELNVKPDAPVFFTYGCAAGDGNTAPDQPWWKTITPVNYPSAATGKDWYLIVAAADIDGGAKTYGKALKAGDTGLDYAVFSSSSFAPEILGQVED